MTGPVRRTFEVFGFGSTHAALDAEALLGDMGIEVTPIPPPPVLTADCGIALRLEMTDVQRALTYLERAGIELVSRVEIEDV